MTSLVLVAIAALIVINGFFVAAEFALVTVRPVQLEGRTLATRLARHQRGQLDQYLAACQLGITIASLALGAIGEPTFARLLEPALESTFLAHGAAIVGSIIAILIMTTLHITVGEQAPKSFAIGASPKVARFCAIPLEGFHRVLRPLVVVLNAASNGLVRMAGGTPASSHAQQASLEELRHMIGGLTTEGQLDESDVQLLRGVFTLDERRSSDVMTPRRRVTAVRSTDTVRGALESTRGAGHSRFPVLGPDGQELVGVVYARELAEALLDGDDHTPIADHLHEMVVVPPTLALDALLARLQERRASICAVLDEYGSFIGVVTIEDIVEEVVGEIWDEADEPDGVSVSSDGTMVCRGDLSVHDLADEGIDLDPHGGGAATVAGVIQHRLGRMADVGDIVEVAGIRLQVLALDGNAITRVAVVPAARRDQGEDSAGRE